MEVAHGDTHRPGTGGCTAPDGVPRQNLDGIVCAEPSRFTREPAETAIVNAMLEKTGARVFYASGQNGDGPSDVLMREIMGMYARFERAQIIARTRAGKTANVKTKGHTWTRAPYGYRPVRGPDGKLAGRVEVVEDEAAVVRSIFAMRARGVTLHAIADALNKTGAPPPAARQGGFSSTRWEALGVPRWTHISVTRILERHGYYRALCNQLGGVDGVTQPAIITGGEIPEPPSVRGGP